MHAHAYTHTLTHTHTHTAALHPEWMSLSQISVLFVLCPFTQTGPQSLSLSLSPRHLSFVPAISIAGLHLTLSSSCLWVSEPLRPPTSLFTPSPMTPLLILSLLRLCHCLHHTLQGAAVNIWLYPAQRSGAILADLQEYMCCIWEAHTLILIFFLSLLSTPPTSLSLRPYSPCFLACQTPAGERPCLIEGPQHQGPKETSWDWTHSPSSVQVS